MTVNSGVEPGIEGLAAPERAPGCDACEGTDAAPCSKLYEAPVPFQGRSLEGAPIGEDSKELARPLDAQIPVDDLFPIEPGPVEPDMKCIVVCRPVIDGTGEEAALVERRTAYAQSIGTNPGRKRDPVRIAPGGGTEASARQAANNGWAAFVSTKRVAPQSFGSDPNRMLSLVDPETASFPGKGAEAANPYPGADPRNALDLSRAARCVSGTRGRTPDRRTGFGRVAYGWNECPFSSRERILNALSGGESLRPDWFAAPGSLPSSGHPTTMPMIADAGGRCLHVPGHMHSSRGRRLLQLIEMLDCAAVVV